MFNLNFNFIKKIKRKIFPFYRDKELKLIFKILQKGLPSEKTSARFVGGCVRKHLTGEKIDDIDVATILPPEEIKKRFKNSNFKIIDTGIEHGTVTLLSQNYKIEITTLRKDIKTDGRHAQIEFTDDWRLDSERRDFTINAIYLDTKGKIFDPQMGIADLKNKNIKFIGDPHIRIQEDYLRIIRFIRFKIIYNTKVEATTSDAIKQNLDGIKKISKERILLELYKILDNENFLKILESNQLKEIFSMIFPEFSFFNNLERLKKIYNYSLLNRDILLAVMLIDGKDNHEYFAHKYNVSNKIKNNLAKLAFNFNEIKKNRNFFEKDLLKNIYFEGKNHLISLNILNFSNNKKMKLHDFSKILNQILITKEPKFNINGEFLKQNGMKESENLGRVLKLIEDEWIKNKFKISQDRVKELIKINSS